MVNVNRRRLLLLGVAAAFALVAQSAAPTLQPVYDGSVTVSGKAAIDGAPISIFDVTNPVRTRLGQGSSMDKDGNFTVALKSPVRIGTRLIAVDRSGRASAAVAVQRPPAASRKQ